MEHSKEIRGLIFGIQPFSIHDGNGIRTNVFFKGCPLRCLWCHNPEGLSPKIDLQYFENKCRRCGKCGNIYQNMNKVLHTSAEMKQKYADSCCYGALDIVGNDMSVEEVIEEVMEDWEFYYTSNGGITISGGEPMFQFDFLYELLKRAKEKGLSTALETSGYADRGKYERIMPYVDEFLWDYKETDSQKHKEFTGVGNEKIIENLKFLYEKGAKITLRCPIIPGVNDTEEHFYGISSIIKEFHKLKGWEIMPYHKLGIQKEKRIGRNTHREFQIPSKGTVEVWKQKIERNLKKMHTEK